MENNEKTFWGIGDIVIDDFIFLKNAKVSCDIDEINCRISMRWGDKIPFDKVVSVPAVGNSINASVSASRFGLKSFALTNVGDDERGERCIRALKKEGVDTSLIKIHSGESTNQHYVLSFESERTILIKHTQFDYTLPEAKAPDLLYLSSLAENSVPFHDTIMDFAEKNPETLLSFQPGTFQISLGYETLKRVYKRAHLFFCNVTEAKRILKTDEKDIKTLLSDMHKLGPKIVIITDGPKGAYAFDGNKMFFMPPYPDPKPPFERTGAGDSFSSAFSSFIALGMSIEEALTRAPINSMSVVQYIGAQEGLLTLEEIEKYLSDAPIDYKIKEI